MNVKELEDLRESLEDYLGLFRDCIKTVPSRRHLRTYIRGQLSDLHRKSVEPIALQAKVPPRTLQEFLSIHRWDHNKVKARHMGIVAQNHSSDSAIAVIDDTGCQKKGDRTPGVHHQYCGSVGKQANCFVSVALGYVVEDFHSFLDMDLYLPKAWTDDRKRCKRAGVPDDLDYRPKWRIALDMLSNARSSGLDLKWVTADSDYGRSQDFRESLEDQGLLYVLEVPDCLTGWTKAPKIQEAGTVVPSGRTLKNARIKPFQPKARKLAELWERGGPTWQYFEVKDSEKGPIVWRARESSFTSARTGHVGRKERLIVAEEMLTGEVKYFFSNAPESVSLAELLTVAFSRWHIEQLFKEAKDEAGYDHFEGRRYKALKRHMILTILSVYFLSQETQRLRKKKLLVVSVPSEESNTCPT